MAQWAHLEITVDGEGNIELGGYNADPAGLVVGTESWEDLMSSLGRNGFELVQILPGEPAVYWFKKQLGDAAGPTYTYVDPTAN